MLIKYTECGHIGRSNYDFGKAKVHAFIKVAEIREAVEEKDTKCPDCRKELKAA